MQYSRISPDPKNKFAAVELLPADLMADICDFVEPRSVSGAEDAFLVELATIVWEAELEAVTASLADLETVQQLGPVKSATPYAAKGLAASQVRGGLVVSLTPPTTTHSTTIPAPSYTTSTKPSWASLTVADKAQAVYRHAAQNDGAAFSLNFTAKNAARLQSSKDPAHDLSRSLNRAAKATFGFLLPLSFTFEFTAAGRLHVHGCAILPVSIPNALAMFRRVLKIVGGKVTGLGSGRQCDVRFMHDSTGWHSYSGKDAARTCRLLRTEKITFISQDLRRATEDAYRAQSVIVTHRRVRTVKRATDTRKVVKTTQRAVMSQREVPARRVSLAIDHVRQVRSKSVLIYYHKMSYY